MPAVCLNNSALDLYTHPYSLCTALYYPVGCCCVLCTACRYLGDYCDAVYCSNYGKVHLILRCYAYSEWNLWESTHNSQVLLHAELIWGFLAYSQTRHDVYIYLFRHSAIWEWMYDSILPAGIPDLQGFSVRPFGLVSHAIMVHGVQFLQLDIQSHSRITLFKIIMNFKIALQKSAGCAWY